jgi:uncharacterized protein YqjF (DUF2071 family)
MPRPFLTAEWRSLVMLNYEIDPSVLRPLVPRGTELDTFRGQHLVSIVGFLMLNTRVLGLPIPFHQHFEEVNLRFYVQRQARDGGRRGVVFVKEVVPRWAIAAVARWLYNENYVACRMSSSVQLPDAVHTTGGSVHYRWSGSASTNAVGAEIAGQPSLPGAGSEEEFITEHYWGYVTQRDGSTVEYQVAHPQWRVWQATAARLDCDVAAFYGAQYAAALKQPPRSAFVAEGSAIVVHQGQRLR